MFDFKGKSAFTLIELLVVISIIALLMAILIPTLSKAKELANETVCQSRLRQWGTAWSMYTGDNNGFFCMGYMSHGQSGHGWEKRWMQTLAPYYTGGIKKDDYGVVAYEAKNLLLCPRATKSIDEAGKLAFATWSDVGYKGSYGVNNFCFNPPPTTYNGQRITNIFNTPVLWNWRTFAVQGADNIPLQLDCAHFWARPIQEAEPPFYEGELEGTYAGWGTMKTLCITRHDGFINGLMLDFSVRKIGLKELWELKWHKKYEINGLLPVWPYWMRKFKDYRVL
jgi:prepilin-type N-terminal cleavage/methylation domain-containing protein